METLLIVNGEKYWQDFFPEYQVVQKRIQHSNWVLKNQELYVVDAEGTVKPDCILWRVGAIKPSEIQTTALNLIDLAQIPCVNSPQTLKMGFDRLSMLSALKKCGFPVINFHVVTQARLLKNIELPFPFVVKAGNYHGGYGKVLITDEVKWQDVKDLLFMSNDYITVEPFINYKYDIRYIIIGEKVWAMSRRGKFWKANVATKSFKLISPQEEMVRKLKALRDFIQAEVVAIDILEEENGTQHIVEYNDIPGLSGFPDELKYELASVAKASFFKKKNKPKD